MKRSVILAVLDGWGIGREDFSNPVHAADLQNINYIKANFPSVSLQASGISVGLPWGEEGNSEVGHLNMGAGKVIYQNYPKITLSVRDASFFQKEVLKKAFEHAVKNNSNLNLVGLLTDANVHASLEHLLALIEMAEKEKFPKSRLNLHLITDGRDSPPESAVNLINKLPNPEQLASLAGRFYTMDRDNHWDRVQKGYQALTGDALLVEDFKAHVEQTYQKNLNDEYVVPAMTGKEKRPIKDNDAVVFFNFREDRMRQIVGAFIEKNFNKFPVKKFSNLYIATMIKYRDDFDAPVVFPEEKIKTPLSKVLSDAGKTQWRIAETEKYAHITYFFNGEEEQPFPNEYRVLIPSKIVARYDEHPEMMAEEITRRLIEAVDEKAYDFILVNYANSDIIAHTGNFDSAVQAVKIIDGQLGKALQAALANDAILIITSDHGNVERMRNPETGEAETKHDPSPVPFYLIAKEFQKPRSVAEINQAEKNPAGVLADISPTILEIMGVVKPKEMTGQSLLRYLI